MLDPGSLLQNSNMDQMTIAAFKVLNSNSDLNVFLFV